MIRNKVINMLGNFKLDDKDIMNMDFGANKTPVEIIKEDAFGGTKRI